MRISVTCLSEQELRHLAPPCEADEYPQLVWKYLLHFGMVPVWMGKNHSTMYLYNEGFPRNDPKTYIPVSYEQAFYEALGLAEYTVQYLEHKVNSCINKHSWEYERLLEELQMVRKDLKVMKNRRKEDGMSA